MGYDCTRCYLAIPNGTELEADGMLYHARCLPDPITAACPGCQFAEHVDADQSFDGGEWSAAFDYGDGPDHSAACIERQCDDMEGLLERLANNGYDDLAAGKV